MLDLAFLNQILDRSRHIFDRYIRVHTMLIEQINRINPKALERGFSDFLDVLWPTIETALFPRINLEPELSGYRHFPTEGGKSFTHKLFVCERAINFGGIEKCDAAFNGRPDQPDSRLLIDGGAVAKAQPHATQADGRDF